MKIDLDTIGNKPIILLCFILLFILILENNLSNFNSYVVNNYFLVIANSISHTSVWGGKFLRLSF